LPWSPCDDESIQEPSCGMVVGRCRRLGNRFLGRRGRAAHDSARPGHRWTGHSAPQDAKRSPRGRAEDEDRRPASARDGGGGLDHLLGVSAKIEARPRWSTFWCRALLWRMSFSGFLAKRDARTPISRTDRRSGAGPNPTKPASPSRGRDERSRITLADWARCEYPHWP